MKIERAALLDALDIVKPALASKDLVQALTHIWFDGKVVSAYNDTIGITVPLATEFKGGLKGNLLLGLLNNSRAKEVELTPGDDSFMSIKAAGAKGKIALLPPSDALFQMPALGKGVIELTEPLLASLSSMLVSIGQDSSIADSVGVTLLLTSKALQLLSTDSATLSYDKVAIPPGYSVEHAVLSPAFITQLLRLCKGGGKLVITEDSAIAENKKGVRLFGRLIFVERPLDFHKIITQYVPKGYERLAVPIPGKLAMAIERAIAVMDGKPDRAVLAISDGVLTITSKSAAGELKDRMTLEGATGDLVVSIDIAHFKRALPLCTDMLLTENCLILLGAGEFTHLIQTQAVQGE